MNRILKAISPLFLALMATGCSGDVDSTISPGTDITGEPDKVNFEINVYAGEDPDTSGSRLSRTPEDEPSWGGDSFYPDPLARYPEESMHTLRVILVRPSGEIEANEYITRLPQAGVNEFHGIRLKVIGGEKKKVYLFANEASIASLSGDTSGSDFFSSDQFHVGQQFPSGLIGEMLLTSGDTAMPLIDNTGTGDKLNIPMSEVFDIDIKAPVKEEDYYQSADLFVTRALSKFSFTISSTEKLDADCSIGEIRISSVGNSMYMLPANTVYSPAKYPTTFDPRYITAYDVPDGAVDQPFIFKPGTALTLTSSDSPDTPKTYAPAIYFAETKLPAGADGKQVCKISVKFAGEDNWHITDAPLPNLPSLPRNTHVKINLTISRGILDCTVTVLPYTGVYLNPDFGIDRD